jgi:hypothetical protein
MTAAAVAELSLLTWTAGARCCDQLAYTQAPIPACVPTMHQDAGWAGDVDGCAAVVQKSHLGQAIQLDSSLVKQHIISRMRCQYPFACTAVAHHACDQSKE